MAKEQKKSMKKFKKAVASSIESMQKMLKKRNNEDGAILLVKKGTNGVTFIEGSHNCIKTIIKESCIKDKSFMKIITEVVDDLNQNEDESDTLKNMLKDSGIDLPEGAVAMEIGSLGNPSDKEVEDFVNKMLKDLHDKRNDKKED
jgi:hypothetical protein